MNTDAAGRPLPPGWGKQKRRRNIAYRIRRRLRKIRRLARIHGVDLRNNNTWTPDVWKEFHALRFLIRGSHCAEFRALGRPTCPCGTPRKEP